MAVSCLGQHIRSGVRLWPPGHASWNWSRLVRLSRRHRLQNAATLGLVLLGPILAVATFVVLGPLDQGSAQHLNLRLVLLADLIYVLLLAALVLQRVARMIAARRAKSAGSRLHLRLTGVFALMALLPTDHGRGLCRHHHQHRARDVVFRTRAQRGRRFA